MEKTRNILMILYWLLLAVAAAVYVCGDYLDIDLCLLSHEDQSNIIVQMLMVLLTLAMLPLALRLFKFSRIHSQLVAEPAPALLRWGVVRLLMLGVVLIANTLLYYIYAFEPAYGYLAVMTMLCMPFVMPTMSRCKAETEEA